MLPDEPPAPLPDSHLLGGASLGPEALKDAIRADLNASVDIPDGHRGGTVWFLNQDKMEIAIATRVVGADGGKITWDIEGVVSHPWTGGRTGFGVLNKITW